MRRSWMCSVRHAVAIGAVIALPALARAQDRRVPNPPVRKAGIAPAPAAAPAPGAVESPLGVQVLPPGQPFLASVPILVLPDGRVFADFGYGFEPIVRSCNTTVVAQPSPAQSVAPQQPVVTQPTPAQQTSSEQMLNTRPAAAPVANTIASNSCWTTQAGPVQVYRR